MRILMAGIPAEKASGVAEALKKEGFSIDVVPTMTEALGRIGKTAYDAAVMDIDHVTKGTRSPDPVVIATVREQGVAFPLLVVSGSGDPALKVKALNLGADDYLVRPFAAAELVARVRALLRREKTMTGPVLRAGDLVMDTLTRTVTRAGRPIRLGRKEFALLEFLMRNAGIPLTRTMILEHAWDMDADPFTNTVDVHVSFLRAKLDKGRRASMIKTVYGYGYKLENSGGKFGI